MYIVDLVSVEIRVYIVVLVSVPEIITHIFTI